MIKDLLSRYSLRYPRYLVYMLQASEYNIRDYLAWYHKTKNFTRIERRKQFVEEALRELDQFEKLYGVLDELEGIFTAINRARRKNALAA